MNQYEKSEKGRIYFSDFTENWAIFCQSLAGLYLTEKYTKYLCEIGHCNYDGGD